MSWPVFEPTYDFANFMKWMRDPNGDGDTSDSLADDDQDSRCTHWWDAHAFEAEYYDEMSGVVTGTTSDDCGGEYVKDIDHKDWLKFSQVDFGTDGVTKVRARIKVIDEDATRIEFEIDALGAGGTKIAEINVSENSSWHIVEANLTQKVTGVHDLYVEFHGKEAEGDVYELNWFQFADVGWENYTRLDPDQIYLVSSVVGHTMINYTDSNGDAQQVSALNDVMWKTSDNNDSDPNPTASSSNYRDDWLKNAIIVAKNAAGQPWKLPATLPSGSGSGEEGDTGDTPVVDLDVDPEDVTIETVLDGTDGKYYVLFPTLTEDINDGSVLDAVYSGHGQRLELAQDVPLTNLEVDPRTGIVTDRGFLGALRTAGFYFAGVFEKSGGPIDFTIVDTSAEELNGKERVYVFATGKWLNFMKLVEDFQAHTYTASKDEHYWNYGFQQYVAWRNICDKSAGDSEPGWTMQDTNIQSHDTEYWCDEDENDCSGEPRDYPSSPQGDFLRSTISPPGADTTEIEYIRVRFQYIDTDGCSSGTNNDYVDLQDANGNSLLAIKGQQIHPGSEGDEALVSYDGGATWVSPNQATILDSAGYTEPIAADYLRVVWHNGNSNGCSGYDRGFKITGFKFTSQEQINPVQATAGDFYCSNAPSGYGNKIRSRMEVAKAAVKRVVDATSESLQWGITQFNGSPRVLQAVGADVVDVQAAIDGLEAGGGTPMGTSLQDAYVSNYDYYANTADPDDAECASKFMVVMTDGYPSGDSDWDRITVESPTPNFSDTSKSYVDDDGWVDSGGNDNYSDDVAYWLKNEATYEHMVHTIGFTLDNPLLGDMADTSGGIYLTAYSEGQLVNAFHSLSLVMTSTQSFVAPVVSVDQANRTQSGDKIYTAFFRPREGEFWVGNLKKYGLKLLTRSECGRSEPELTVVGVKDLPATDCYGNFLPTATSLWSQVADGGEAGKGGVGALLHDAMPGPHPTSLPSGGNWYNFRNMFTYDTSTDAWIWFTPNNITNTHLGVSTDEERFKLINFIYGYTYDADAQGDPSAKREWILGDIIHSEPTIIDYLDENNNLFRRLIMVGGNDGMLHVFYDDDDGNRLSMTNAANFTEHYIPGREVWAFIPPDLLPKLKLLPDFSDHEYFVDGFSSLKRANYTFWKTGDDATSGPTGDTRVAARGAGEYYKKTVVFGERRGGDSYWTLDVSNPNPMEWTVKWYQQGGGDPALNPSYELKQSWSKPVFATIRTGPNATDLKDVVVFTGGYDPLEDGYPEAWQDDDDDGVKDSGESHTDTAGGTAGTYDYFNPDKDSYGRGIYVVDLETGDPVFRAVYANADGQATDPFHGNTPVYGFTAMKWAFPADSSVIPLSERKLVIYAPDVYGQVWRVNYSYTDSGGAWSVKRIFEANPGSDQTGATDFPPAPALNNNDKGRKTFYAPDISYRGSDWSGDDPVLYFGTGDRAHPRYVNWDGTNGYHDRFYVVADTDSATPTNETKLLNLTCDELDVDSDVDQNGSVDNNDAAKRTIIRNMLYHWDDPDCDLDDCDYPVAGEQARGWYRIMGKQGDCLEDSYDHVGEKVLSRPTLFFRIAYFTTFVPSFGNACNPNGDALVYALDYNDGSAVFNLNLANDPDTAGGDTKSDLTDTYSVVQDSTIPSGTRVITRQGHAAGVFSAGGSVVGAGEQDGTGNSTNIPGPPGGASKMLWETF
jgi:type IV pilus assembly protein PilY1